MNFEPKKVKGQVSDRIDSNCLYRHRTLFTFTRWQHSMLLITRSDTWPIRLALPVSIRCVDTVTARY